MNLTNDPHEDAPQTPSPVVDIRVRMPEPWTHYFEVGIEVPHGGGGDLNFVMPVWTPGSYLVREFARNVRDFDASDGTGTPLNWEKSDKCTWRIFAGHAARVRVAYRVYAFEFSVRTSFLDDSHGYINGAGVFMCPDGFSRAAFRVVFEPYPGWNTISTALEPVASVPNGFTAPDYDTLVDCPVEIGNHQVFGFKVGDIPHFVALHGEGNCNPERLCSDLAKIVGTASEIFGGIPYPHFTFIIHLASDGRGGLEHSNSMSLQVSRWAFQPEESYKRFLDLAAHEYFHVWNVKRIRPAGLGPFDYTRENYTRLLWVSEGFTDYYSGRITRKAGILSPDEYLASLAKSIQDFQETPGRLVESAADASFDAWIKFYRQDAHSPNVTVSYYLKGSLIALLLDLEIRHRRPDRSLDDVLRELYRGYQRSPGRGFTDDEFRQACEEVAGGSLQEIFEPYCRGTEELDFDRYLGYAGLRFARPAEQDPAKPRGYLGISLKAAEGRLQVVGVTSGSPAWNQGLNLNDEIIALNGFRMTQELLSARMEEAAPGEPLDFLVARDGRIRVIRVVPGEKKASEVKIEKIPEATADQKQLYESWLFQKWEKG